MDEYFLEIAAALAINHLTRNLDEKRGHLPYFLSLFEQDPPEQRHEDWDWGDITSRYVEALIMARRMTGSVENMRNEDKLKELFLSLFDGGDGLCYRRIGDAQERLANVFDQSRALSTLLTLHSMANQEGLEDRIRVMVNSLWRISAQGPSFRYFSAFQFPPGYVPKGDEPPNDGPTHYGGMLISPLVRSHELFRIPHALDLAEGLARWVMHPGGVFGGDGSFGGADTKGHTHAAMGTVAGVIRLGILLSREDYVEWGRRVLEWFRTRGSGFGWFPEWIGRRDPSQEGCETCTIADVLDVMRVLAHAGYPQYWDAIDRIVRNHLVESQIRDISWIPSSGNPASREILDRVKGGFAGWSSPNDFIGNNPYRQMRMMNCCAGHGTKALYLAWDNLIEKRHDSVMVHLLVNKRSPWVNVSSRLPYAGEATLELLQDQPVHVRIPPWVSPRQLRLEREGRQRDFEIREGMCVIQGIKAPALVSLRFPVETRQEEVEVNGRRYTVEWRGSTVMGIDPPGKFYPLYADRKGGSPVG